MAVRANALAGTVLFSVSSTGDAYVTHNLFIGANVVTWSAYGTNLAVNDGTNQLYYCTHATAGGHHFFRGTTNVYAATFAAAFNVSSARETKTAIQPIEDPLRIVLDPTLRGITFQHIGDAELERKVGFIADDWQAVVPEVVSLSEDGRVLAMDYAAVGAITFEALKQYALQTDARLSALEAKLAA